MFIRSAHIKNYRSILDSGELTFSAGFNLIVGANNVGKSSLLLALAAKYGGEPHKSIRTARYRDAPLNPISSVALQFVVTGAELTRILIDAGSSPRYFPWPLDTPVSQDHCARVLHRLLSAEEIPMAAKSQATQGQAAPNWLPLNDLATKLYAARPEGGHFSLLHVTVNSAAREIAIVSPVQAGAAANDFGFTASQMIAAQIYRFGAERLSLGTGSYGTNPELASDARNLPEVLNILQGNPARFADYCSLVKEVFPTIEKITLKPINAQQGEIMVWQVDPALERDDLAMPLTQCGTGVGQVLAMLYVAKISEHPRIIIIDEPGSFLHPGASRALIAILKRFSKHQYIITTHSPEIIAELSEAPVSIVRWSESKTVIEQAPSATGAVASATLNEVGARLSDVFGFDEVMWIEGQSDALSMAFLRDVCGKSGRRLAILPLRDTGSFRKRTIAEVLDIYRRLSMGGALLPPALDFVFDRDGRTDRQIEDAIREGRGKVKFLSRRMFENFLLNPIAIAHVFNESGRECGINTTNEIVDVWILEHGTLPGVDRPVPFSQPWLDEVDGATLLEELFAELSENRLPFRKTTHTPLLTKHVFAIDQDALRELTDLLAVERAPT